VGTRKHINEVTINKSPAANMLLQQTALVPMPTLVGGLYISSRNKITKGGLRQAQDRCALCEK
jgi:hypothetical protein